MRLKAAIPYFLLVCIVASTASGKDEGFTARVEHHSVLTHEGELQAYLRELKGTPGHAPWDRDFALDFDKTAPGAGIVYSLRSHERCSAGSGSYEPADCGTDMVIVFSQAKTGYLGAVFVGPRFAPGTPGCFGLSESLHVKVVRETSAIQVIDVQTDFKLFNLRKPAERCPDFHLSQRIDFLKQE